MRLVIKIGSNILANETGLNTRRIASIVSNVAKLHKSGHEIIIVSSGAVAAGAKKMRLGKRPTEIKLKQAAAAVGQSDLIWTYDKSFKKHSIRVAQILLTREGLADRKMHNNAKNTMLTLLSHKVVPIVNENDTVATEEIKFGDNDKLAALVSTCAEADRLIILSDVDGLYDANPKESKSAKIIGIVEKINENIICLADRCTSAVGTGGMLTKLQAAQIATQSGIGVHIINGKTPSKICHLMEGKAVGTQFKADKSPLKGRKSWLLHSSKSKGTLTLDGGAVKALLKRNKSLLPSGIIEVEGRFDDVDTVKCADPHGNVIARGIVNYSSDDLHKIKGRKTSEIEGILGYKYSDEAIHRDNLVITVVTKGD